MTFSEALDILRASSEQADFHVVVACSFTPLHIQTFIAAHIQQRLPERRVTVETGLFGDLARTLRESANKSADAIAILIEWSDLDARLGYRTLGGWGCAEEDDILAEVATRLQEFRALIELVGQGHQTALSLPTLPLPPAFMAPRWQVGRTEAALDALVHRFAADLSLQQNLLLINRRFMDLLSPLKDRFDLKSDIQAGLPYKLNHASLLGELFARLFILQLPKKGLITDLDGTLWRGIVGDVGTDAISWDIQGKGHIHGLYQQTLRALAEQGVLIAVASKNEADTVHEAMKRPDLIVNPDALFPIEASWQTKSRSVSRILQTWNICSDSIVFVDDDPLELEEVHSAFPDLECCRFLGDDYDAADSLFRHLRDIYAKPAVSSDDTLRVSSIRTAVDFSQQLRCDRSTDDFFSRLNARLSIGVNVSDVHDRAFELINKTNQFNLNGIRLRAPSRNAPVGQGGKFLWTVSYEDRFGPLGTIAVLHGHREEHVVHIETWVMSCRALSRRIEHQCLKSLFERYEVGELALSFQTTSKNGAMRAFLESMITLTPASELLISREVFTQRCPLLFHSVTWSNL